MFKIKNISAKLWCFLRTLCCTHSGYFRALQTIGGTTYIEKNDVLNSFDLFSHVNHLRFLTFFACSRDMHDPSSITLTTLWCYPFFLPLVFANRRRKKSARCISFLRRASSLLGPITAPPRERAPAVKHDESVWVCRNRESARHWPRGSNTEQKLPPRKTEKKKGKTRNEEGKCAWSLAIVNSTRKCTKPFIAIVSCSTHVWLWWQKLTSRNDWALTL